MAAVCVGDQHCAGLLEAGVSNKSKAAAIGRKTDAAVHVGENRSRCSAEDRNLVELRITGMLLIRPGEIDVVAVWRKSESTIAAFSGRRDLGDAVRGDVAHRETLLACIFDHMDHIFAISPDGGHERFAAVSKLADGHGLKR